MPFYQLLSKHIELYFFFTEKKLQTNMGSADMEYCGWRGTFDIANNWTATVVLHLSSHGFRLVQRPPAIQGYSTPLLIPILH